ncbi:sensor histidine kinase [Streptosporangium sandarakinum]|uniref:sensor histidine kinase n=1 Tax=Streptosporangium sandarakinum TaxID=1260955 RepID=UPI0036CA5B62
MSRVPVPRLAQVIAGVAFAGFAAVYVLAGSPLAVLAFGLQLVYVSPGLRRFRRPWLPAVQALVCYTAVLGFGTSVGILGFVGGSLLLTRAWPLAVPVAVSAAVIGPADPVISMVLVSLVICGLTRLAERVEEVHAARLALAMAAAAEERLRIAAELNDGIGRGLAGIAGGVRLALDRPENAGEVLGEVVGAARRSLADARAAAAGYRATSLTPEVTTARAMLAAVGAEVEVRAGHAEPLGPAGALLATVLREVVVGAVRQNTVRKCLIETVAAHGTVRLRVVHDGVRTADDEGLAEPARQAALAGGGLSTDLTAEGWLTVETVLPAPAADQGPSASAEDPRAYRLSLVLLVAVLLGFSAKALLAVPAHLFAPAAACLAVIVVMQVRSVTGRHMAALAVMALLAFAPIPVFGRAWLGVPGFLAGPVLLAFPAAVAWPLTGCVIAGTAVAAVLLGLPVPVTVNFTVSTLVTGLVMYGLDRLTQLVRELREARQGLARSAVVEERLRAARDLHDLLGSSLAAILLRCELARRLDPERARAELTEVLAMTGKAEADLRVVSGGRAAVSLADEAETARSVLAAAGVRAELSLAHGALPGEVDAVLGTVLREAVTNVLRHSAARHCVITTTAEEGGVRLGVRNDGAGGGRAVGTGTGGVRGDGAAAGGVRGDGAGGAGVRPGSAGLGNLTTRLAVLGGRLGTARDGDRFELTAWAPVPRDAVAIAPSAVPAGDVRAGWARY